MSLIVSDSSTGGKNYDPAPAGVSVARCIKIVDFGTQKREYNGETKLQKQVMFTWELPEDIIPDGDLAGKPYAINQIYTQSLNAKSNLRRDLESWRGRAFSQTELDNFDLENVLGKPCMLNIVHTHKGDRTYANIASITPLPSKMTCPEQINPSVMFSLAQFDPAKYEALTEWTKKKISESPEYAAAAKGAQDRIATPDGGVMNVDPDNQDIPF
jgi:hypothetical protein